MKITIIGPGAMGCLLAGLLAKSGNEVWLLDKNQNRADNIKKNGIRIEGKTDLQIKIDITTEVGKIGKADLIIIAVKSYDTIQAALSVRSIINSATYILTLQNGIGNVENIKNVLNNPNILGGVTSHGATLLGDGLLRHAGTGDTYIGRLDGKSTTEVKTIAEIFNKSGIDTKISENIEGLLWSKLIINVGINALTAITRLNNGRLIEFEGTEGVLEKAVSEAILVAQKKNIKLIYNDPLERVKEVCRLTSANISSMLQDVLKKRKTEIEYINGAIVKEAEILGISVPVNEVLTNLVKTIESSYAKQLSSSN
ncbi:MAG: 2-dehydropantoate 2-reductase [Candidatus Omnitrophica bacterium]|nr:2-dehydropantoate 2-reductase [Candidatus Omnitrophota bacterium]